MGVVGNDEASAVKCTCPVEFVSIEYDTLPANWSPIKNEASKSLKNEITVVNQCDPAKAEYCPNEEEDHRESITKKFQHNWSNVFSMGLTYTEKASVKLGIFGAEESISLSIQG